MKILSINTSDLGGGAEQIAWSLFRGYGARGFESRMVVGDKKTDHSDVYTYHDNHAHLDYRSRLRLKHKWVGWWWRFCKRYGIETLENRWSHESMKVSGMRPDVIHCHNLHGGYFDLSALVDLSRQVPVFLTLHDAWLASGHCAHSLGCERWRSGCGKCPDLTLEPAIQRDATRFNHWRKRRVLERCKLHVAAPSSWLLERMKQSILAPAMVETRVIRNGVDLNHFRPACKKQARAALPKVISDSGPMLLFVGSPKNRYKDFDALRKAVEILARDGGVKTAAQLVVVGEDLPEEQIGSIKLHYLAPIPNCDLAIYYQAADLYVHAARMESACLAVAEAMACGTPVVATGVGGVPEVLASTENGILVEKEDPEALAAAIAGLLNDQARRLSMGESAASHAARNYSIEQMVDEYLNWFSSAQPRPRAS